MRKSHLHLRQNVSLQPIYKVTRAATCLRRDVSFCAQEAKWKLKIHLRQKHKPRIRQKKRATTPSTKNVKRLNSSSLSNARLDGRYLKKNAARISQA